jgi:hypothetical protein
MAMKPEASLDEGLKEGATNGDEKKEADPLASVSEVFSFAQTTRVKVYIGLGFACAFISGCVFPGKRYVFFFVILLDIVSPTCSFCLQPWLGYFLIPSSIFRRR